MFGGPIKLFKRKTRFTILFKSGNKLTFKADNVKVRSNQANEMTGIDIEEMAGIHHLYFRLDEIEAIVYE